MKKYKITTVKEVRFIDAESVEITEKDFLQFITKDGPVSFERRNLISYELASAREVTALTQKRRVGAISG
jgi:hypothetical protein